MYGRSVDEVNAANSSSTLHFDQSRDVFDGPHESGHYMAPVNQSNSCMNTSNLESGTASELNMQSSNSYEKRSNDQSLGSPSRDHSDRPNLLKRLESIRAWGRNTIKCTKQVIEEKLGTTSPTCDENLDLRIESLRHMQKQYKGLLDLVKQFSVGFSKTVQTQQQVAGQLAHLGQQQLELTAEFAYNAETQRMAVLRSEKLLAALDAFCDGLNTLINHTFEDTFLTIKQMHSARIEYDAYRKEAEVAKTSPRKSAQPDSPQTRRIEEAIARFTTCEKNLNKLKAAVDAKLRLLHENRIRVMQHNLLLLHNSTSAYYSGDEERLDAVLKQFNIRLKSPKSSINSNSSTSPVHHSQSIAQSRSNSLQQPPYSSPVGIPPNLSHDSVSLNGFAPVEKVG